ncbi:RHS repeat-associated core domain-containing protein [Candidatus Eisenbacteria bacterium]|uniref:RHS repeat-associated core domain-containing protein n=1 Tax=Eiseniibacteriota bacterium TaxID=2212470 RepID=A0ABV6YKN1_UNCEI
MTTLMLYRLRPIIGRLLVLIILSILSSSGAFASHIPPAWHQTGDQIGETGTEDRPWWEELLEKAKNFFGTDGEPVILKSGEFAFTEEYLTIPGRGMDLRFSHSYSSGMNFNGPFGFGWTFSYYSRLRVQEDGDVMIIDGDGGRNEYTLADSVYVAEPGVFETLEREPDGSWVRTEAHGTKKLYGVNGCLTALEDRNGNTIQLSYEEPGADQVVHLYVIIGIPPFQQDPGEPIVVGYDYRLYQMTDTVGRTVAFDYNDDGRLTAIHDFADRTVNFEYDPTTNDLLSITSPSCAQYPEGVTKTFSYDTEHNLMTITDAKGQDYLTNYYDSEDRVYQQQYGEGTFFFEYGEDQTTVTDRKGYVTVYDLNDRGNVTRKGEFTEGLRPSDPPSYVTTYTYNEDMMRTSVTYPEGNGIVYSYDVANSDPRGRGNLLEHRRKTDMATPDDDSTDVVTRYDFEPLYNQIVSITDPMGNTTTCTYDYHLDSSHPDYALNGNLVGITFPEVDAGIPEIHYSYNDNGQVEEASDANGNVTRREYHPATGLVWRVIEDPDGIHAVTVYNYDKFGNDSTVTDPNLHTTPYVYNELGWLVETVDAAGHQTRLTHDRNGNVAMMERQANEDATLWQTRTYTYTVLDKIDTGTDPLQKTTVYDYDPNDNLTSVTNPLGHATTLEYDERDRLWRATDAAGYVTEYAYSPNAYPALITDARSNSRGYTYDGFDRLAMITYADSSSQVFQYDKNSNLSELVRADTTAILLSYDELNRLVAKTYPEAPAQDTRWHYDLGSRVLWIVTESCSLSFGYDPMDRRIAVSQAILPGTYNLTYEYDAVGNRTALTYPSGYSLSYEYNENNQLSAIRDTVSIATYDFDVLSRRNVATWGNDTGTEYVYDLGDRLRQIAHYQTQRRQGPSWGTVSTGRFEYRELPPGTFSYFLYDYDDTGHRTGVSGVGIAESFEYDQIHQLIGVTGTRTHTYVYDEVGNRVQADSTVYVTDNLNQYVMVDSIMFEYDACGNLTSDGRCSYSYDRENRLVSISGVVLAEYDYDGLGRRVSKTIDGETMYFVYDGISVVEERSADGGLLASYVFGGYIDEVLVMSRDDDEYWYSADGLGSTTGLLSGLGEVLENVSYAPYGLSDEDSEYGNPYQYSGRRLDDECGLYFYRARYYSPEHGRFLQRDPVDFADGWSAYVYVENSPVTYGDPLGLFKSCDMADGPEEFDYWDHFWEAFWGNINEELGSGDWRYKTLDVLAWGSVNMIDTWATPGVSNRDKILSAGSVVWNVAGGTGKIAKGVGNALTRYAKISYASKFASVVNKKRTIQYWLQGDLIRKSSRWRNSPEPLLKLYNALADNYGDLKTLSDLNEVRMQQ